MPKPNKSKVRFNGFKSNKPSYLPEDSHAYKMAEVARINRISKERSEIQSQKIYLWFIK